MSELSNDGSKNRSEEKSTPRRSLKQPNFRLKVMSPFNRSYRICRHMNKRGTNPGQQSPEDTHSNEHIPTHIISLSVLTRYRSTSCIQNRPSQYTIGGLDDVIFSRFLNLRFRTQRMGGNTYAANDSEIDISSPAETGESPAHNVRCDDV